MKGRWRFEASITGVIFALFYAWISMRDDVIGNLSDSLIYLLMADILSPWYHASHSFDGRVFQQFSFPPLYPLIQGLLGGGSERLAQSYVIDAGLMGLMVAAVHTWCRVYVNRTLDAVLLTSVFALLPMTLLSGLGLQSEALFMALIFAGLACAAVRGGSLFPALVFGLGALVRTAGVAMIVAGALLMLFDKRLKRTHVLGLLITPLISWHGGRALLGAEGGYISNVLLANINQFPRIIEINLAATWPALVANFDRFASQPMRYCIALISVVSAAVWVSRLVRRKLDALFVAAYLAMLMVWPYPEHLERFLFVIMPMVLLYPYLALIALSRRQTSPVIKQFAPPAYLLLLAIVIGPSAVNTVQQIATSRDHPQGHLMRTPQWHRTGVPQQALASMQSLESMLESLKGIDEYLPADACVLSPFTPYVLFYGHRAAQAIGVSSASDTELHRQLAACSYVFMMALGQWPTTGHPPMYPYLRVQHALEVIEVKLWDQGASEGEVMTMLGRVQTHRLKAP